MGFDCGGSSLDLFFIVSDFFPHIEAESPQRVDALLLGVPETPGGWAIPSFFLIIEGDGVF